MDNEEKSAIEKTPRMASSRLRQERERRGWSQGELASRIGTNQVSISRWETGLNAPGPYFRQQLIEVFQKSLEDLGILPDAEVLEDNDADKEEARLRTLPGISIPQGVSMSLWNVPYRRNRFFTGREDILASLYTELNRGKSAALTQAHAISGLGGIGKTQVAVEYAYRYRESYKAILWVTAFPRETLLTNFGMLATLLELPEQQDQDIIVRAVKRWLETHDGWLLILDNAEDLELIADVLPMQGEGNLLLTTRLSALGSIAQSIPVDKMGLEEGMTFLLRRTKVLLSDMPLSMVVQEIQEQASEIVIALDGMPLALDQAGAYIEETQCSYSAYLHLYQTRRKDLLQRRGRVPVDHPESVAATWSLSFQKVEQESLPAADLLRLLTFLNPDAIPEEIIIEGASELGSRLGPVASDELALNDAIELLLRFSLVRRDAEAKLVNIHRLVQVVLKDGLTREQQSHWAERAIRATNRAFPDVELSTWTQCLRCLPHAQSGAAHAKENNLAFPEAARLFNQAANYLSTHAQYLQAEPLLQQALAIRLLVLAPNHPEIASTLNDLGLLYLTQGKYSQSVPLLQQALQIREQVLGLDHSDTASSLNNLALLYFAQGKYPDAEKLYQQALHLRQHVLPPEHPDIAQSLNNLAELYTTQAKYEQAESLYHQALDSQQKVLGPRHPDVAKTLNNLALLYRTQGEYRKAEKYYYQALDIQEELYGENHSDIAQTINNLARLYRAQGEYAKAEPYYQRALTIRQDVFGPEHPHVALSLYGLAKLYTSQGRFQQAEETAKQALHIQEQRLDSKHPDVANTLGILAKICQGELKLDEAKDLNKRALEIRENTFDPNHLHIAYIYNNLAEIFHAQGNYLEAKPLIDRSIQIRAQVLGTDHPYMAYSLSNLAENYYLKGDYLQAETFWKKALAIREKNLGTDHPRTASTYHNLAKLYTTQGRYEEAEPLFRRVLTIRDKALGPDHPAVMTTLENYLPLLHAEGNQKLACEVEERIQRIKAIREKPS